MMPMRAPAGDVWFGGTLLILGGALLHQTFDARYAGQGAGAVFSPMFYPRIVLGIWIALAAILVVKGLLAGRSPPAAHRAGRFALLAGLLVVVIAALPIAGFLPAATLFVLLAPPILGYRRPVPWLLTAALFPAAVWHIFNNVLNIPLPASAWLTGL